MILGNENQTQEMRQVLFRFSPQKKEFDIISRLSYLFIRPYKLLSIKFGIGEEHSEKRTFFCLNFVDF